MKQLGRHVPDHTHILFGLGVDAKLGDAIAITLISSLGLNQLNAHASAAPPAEMMQQPAAARLDKPQPVKRATPLRKTAPAPAPVKENDLPFFTDEEMVRPAPVEVSDRVEAAPAHEEVEEVFHDEPVEQFIEEEPAAEIEEPAPFEEEELPELAPAPIRTPVARELAEIARHKESTLASVVARSVSLHSETTVMQDEVITFEQPVVKNSAPAPALARKPAPDPQQTFSLGEEDRGRFKDTQPSIVQGEDLDVPTWMRLKKKLRTRATEV
jgi:cell division protein FtsZ